MNKFNVGERYAFNWPGEKYDKTVIEITKRESVWNFFKTISGNVPTISGGEAADKFSDVSLYATHLVLCVQNKIVITRDGSTTLARLYEGDKVIKSAESKCSPSDTYDFNVGARMAFDRLVEPAFDWNKFKAREIAVRCDTGKKAQAFMCEARKNIADRMATWKLGETSWDSYKNETKYGISDYGGSLAYCGSDMWNNRIILDCPFTEVPEPDLSAYEWVDGYKGFDSNLQCKGFQYEVGKEYDLGEEESACHKGFHFCKTLDEVHAFYDDNGTNRFCKVSGLVKKDSYDGKFCARKIKIGEEIKLYYSGKVICTKDLNLNKDLFTVGRVYNYTDGIVRSDRGHGYNQSNPAKNKEEALNRMLVTFIEHKGEA